MSDRLVVAVLGTRNSGKSTTWNKLFNATVKTGKYQRSLNLNAAQSVEVFVISGSPQEREKDIEDILPDNLPQIVLCSTQYRPDVIDTYKYFIKNGYEIFVQWLNPGHNDAACYPDTLNIREQLLSMGATLQERNGAIDPTPRVKELRQFLLGWATYRGLVQTEFPA